MGSLKNLKHQESICCIEALFALFLKTSGTVVLDGQNARYQLQWRHESIERYPREAEPTPTRNYSKDGKMSLLEVAVSSRALKPNQFKIL